MNEHEKWIEAAQSGMYHKCPASPNDWVYKNSTYSATLLRVMHELAVRNTPLSEMFEHLSKSLNIKTSHIWAALDFLQGKGLIELDYDFTGTNAQQFDPTVCWFSNHRLLAYEGFTHEERVLATLEQHIKI